MGVGKTVCFVSACLCVPQSVIIPPEKLLTAHLTSLLPLNQHLKSFSVLLGPGKGKLAHQFGIWQRRLPIQNFPISSHKDLGHIPQTVIIFFHVGFPLQSGKTVTIRESEVHMVFVKNMHSPHIIQSSRKQTLVEVTASFPVTVSGLIGHKKIVFLVLQHLKIYLFSRLFDIVTLLIHPTT